MIGTSGDGADAPEAGIGPTATVTIRCREHGPLVVELPGGPDGPTVALRVTDHLGQAFPVPAHKRAVALCRCGQTKSPPFCDGAHKTCGFSAANLAPATDRS